MQSRNQQIKQKIQLVTSMFLVFFLIAQIGNAQRNKKDWKLITEDANIQVFTRKTDKSPIKEVRILAEFDVEFETFVSVLNDVPAYGDWIYKCNNTRKIKSVNANKFYYYVQTDFPFPMSDRDLIVLTEQWREDDGLSYFSKSIATPHMIKKEKGKVRIEFYESSWNVRQDKYGHLLIDYRVVADPAGSLPTWLVNMAVTQGPIQTMRNLEAFVKKHSLIAGKNKRK